MRTGKQGTNNEEGTEERKECKRRQKLQCLESDKLPPFPETAKKKRNQRSIRAEMISSPTAVIGDQPDR